MDKSMSTRINRLAYAPVDHIWQKAKWHERKLIWVAALYLLSQMVLGLPALAASESAQVIMAASQVIERDGKYYLYQNGNALNATGYDYLSIEHYIDLPRQPSNLAFALAQLGSQYGLLDANTGKVVLPLTYEDIQIETLARIGLIQVRKDDLTSFVDSKGQPAKVPAYNVVSAFTAGQGLADNVVADFTAGQGLAERDGKLLVLTFRDGQLRDESAAPLYLPSIILPPPISGHPEKSVRTAQRNLCRRLLSGSENGLGRMAQRRAT
jgi:hypothetical protein